MDGSCLQYTPMTNDLYLQITTELAGTIEDVYDGKLPDSPWMLTVPVICAQVISDTPTSTIDASIALREQRLTLEVQAQNLDDARLIKEALIVALHGWRGSVVKVATFENGGPELYDSELNPPRYILPVDFMLTF